MKDQIEQSIANSLEVEKQLLPQMPFLLQDLWALGSAVDDIIDSVASLNLSPDVTKVLDLGCGKGAVSIQIASEFGFKVVGVDVMIPFLEEACKKASEYHVSHLCRFINKDITYYVSAEHKFDLVILASMGGILGSFKETIAKLRNQVRTGGYILIDDGYLRQGNFLNRQGYEHYRNHQNTIKELTVFNDHLLKEINTTELSVQIDCEYLSLIEKRGNELADKHPELAEDINAYIRRQSEECEVLKNQIEGALWLLQKGS